MRVLYIDIDSLRPDHLGCYGYHRDTSPNIDRVSAEGVRFEHCHVPDAPCLPSRTALFSGRFGIHNGVINHGGAAADPFRDAPLPAWLTEEARQQHWRGCWPHSAQEVTGYGAPWPPARNFPRQPTVIDSMAEVRRMFDGYDTGVRYADDHVGVLLNAL